MFTKKSLILLLCIFVFTSNQTNIPTSVGFDQKMTDLLVQNQCSIPPKQTKVAIWTMTHLRVGKQSLDDAIAFFNDYLKRYAESQCDAFDSIYLIWNNEESPQFYGFTQNKKNWKKKVHFLHTESNSLDFRYIVPEWVEEEVLLNLDDDAVITCEGIKNSLKQYNERSIGGFGPIGGTLGRIVNYNLSSNAFQNPPVAGYGHRTIHNYVLPGLSILSKHTAELYYSRIFQFRKIREITQKLMNCEDIAANFMTNSLYDDVVSFFVKNMSENLLPSNFELHHHSEFETERKRCGYWFCKIFGKNPNQFVYEIDSYALNQNRTKPIQNNPCLTLVKKGTIQNRYFTHEYYFLNLKGVYAYGVTQQMQKMIDQHNKVMQLQYSQKKQLIENGKVDISYHSKTTLQRLLKLESELNVQKNMIEQIVKPMLPLILDRKLTEYSNKLFRLRDKQLQGYVQTLDNLIKDTQRGAFRLKLAAVLLILAIFGTVIKIILTILNKKSERRVKVQFYDSEHLQKI